GDPQRSIRNLGPNGEACIFQPLAAPAPLLPSAIEFRNRYGDGLAAADLKSAVHFVLLPQPARLLISHGDHLPPPGTDVILLGQVCDDLLVTHLAATVLVQEFQPHLPSFPCCL